MRRVLTGDLAMVASLLPVSLTSLYRVQVAWCPELNRDVGFQLRLRGEEGRSGLQWRDFTLQGKAREDTGERTQDSGYSGSLARSPGSSLCVEGGEDRTARKTEGRSSLASNTRSGHAVPRERDLVVSSLAQARGRSLALGREVRGEEARCRREELELLEERAWKYHYCWQTGEVEATGLLECHGRAGGGAARVGDDGDGSCDSDSSDIRYQDNDSYDSDSSGASTSKGGAAGDRIGGSIFKGGADIEGIGDGPFKVGADDSEGIGDSTFKIGAESEGIGGSTFKIGAKSDRIGDSAFKIDAESDRIGDNTFKIGAESDMIGDSTAGVTTSGGVPAQNNRYSDELNNCTSKAGVNSDSSDSDSDTDSDSSSGSTSNCVAASDGIGGSTAGVTTAEGVSAQNNSDNSDEGTVGISTTQGCSAAALSGGSSSSDMKAPRARKRPRPADPAPSCEYERIRARNIAERRAGLARLEAGGLD